jgi:glucose uptake protein GlcU
MDSSNIIETTTPIQLTSGYPDWAGFLCLAISIFFYGTFLLPVKKYDTGDGVFFQFVLCSGIFLVGFIVNCIQSFPTFYGLPMIGGVLFTTGNLTSVPIIKFTGLSVGILIWGTVSLVAGWANARFGWFGIKEQIPRVEWMNYLGVSLATLSGFFYIFVKNEKISMNIEPELVVGSPKNSSFLKRNLTRVIGVIMAIFAGIMYGLSYTPIIYVTDNYIGSSKNGLDYSFSFYTGILFSSLIYFIIYCAYKRNSPVVNLNAILPGFASGIMWGIANSLFLIANSTLSQAVTFPIGASGPPIVATLWAIFKYKEIKGKRNFIILSIGFSIGLLGAIFSGLSK